MYHVYFLIWPNMEYPFPFLTRVTLFFARVFWTKTLEGGCTGDGCLFIELCGRAASLHNFSFLFLGGVRAGKNRMRIATAPNCTVHTYVRSRVFGSLGGVVPLCY